jgi:ABC-type polysaccharide/polyol phosphate transport system ATPase subunit
MKPAIRVENLTKEYRIGLRQPGGYTTLREALTSAVAAPFRKLRSGGRLGANGQKSNDTFLALKDVSFEVNPGEVVGIIGRNGAGKSTLLKILSRITEPTRGRVEVRGRMGSLLEVGTGFHPELTGRENICMNGSILGMSFREIERKFDEIVAFAEIDQFLDTPVKRYSSGMYIRLAFAVAAHLEPEILVVDEVLAVGDVAFQKKCLSKMEDVSHNGRTVLFVSHNMGAIQRLCGRCIYLQQGNLIGIGSKTDVIASYLASDVKQGSVGSWIDLSQVKRKGNGEARFIALNYKSSCPMTADMPYPDGPLDIRLLVESNISQTIGGLVLTLYDRFGTKLVNADIVALGKTIELRKGRIEILFRIESLHLNPGIYSLGLSLASRTAVFDQIETATNVEVMEMQNEGFGKRPYGDGAVSCSFQIELTHS